MDHHAATVFHRLPLALVLLAALLATAGTSMAQEELRRTFLSDAEAALAAADAQDAKLLAPRAYEDGVEDFADAEVADSPQVQPEFPRLEWRFDGTSPLAPEDESDAAVGWSVSLHWADR